MIVKTAIYFREGEPFRSFGPSLLRERMSRREQGEIAMFYAKNVGSKERIVRTVGGVIMILCGAIGLQLSPLGLLLGGAGIVTILTGLVGFCPACAMVGRKPVERTEIQ